MKYLLPIAMLVATVCQSFADGPADNNSETVRPIPPIGIELAAEQSEALDRRCAQVRSAWQKVIAEAESESQKGNKWQRAKSAEVREKLRALTPEILVFPRAVEMAMEFQQFYKAADVDNAMALLDEATRRIDVARTTPVWSRVVGIDDGDEQQLIIGGFRSEIDGSVQPYAVVIPSGFTHGDSRARRLDLWFHGRGETLSEVSFLTKGRTNAGQYTPSDTFVLHPYGRYSNAFKFAGEIDVLEALRHVMDHLPVDDAKISVRGFSMGGAACWQFATHYADRFFAANPGAGFSETPQFLKSFQEEDLSSTPDYQKTLWRWYDCDHWSRNLAHCPTVAYSGEIDRQKQAADVMEQALARESIDLVHIIGPETGHKIHPDSKIEIERRMRLLEASASAAVPLRVEINTQTLRYHRMYWLSVMGMKQHWETATVKAAIRSDHRRSVIVVSTDNVTHLRFEFESGQWPGRFPANPRVLIDGEEIEGTPIRSDRSWVFDVALENGKWAAAQGSDVAVRKRPGLQGPIDDAFMDSFLFVTPTGTSADTDLQNWVGAEAEHAQVHWRKHFRGDVRRVDDRSLTKEHLKKHNLILFGDPESNSVIARIADALPIKWTSDSILVGSKTYPRDNHAAVLIFPNPLNGDRYIVLNSGFTFREYDYLNNARQTPKLPDWAIINVEDGATSRDPGKVIEAGFFDERWNPIP